MQSIYEQDKKLREHTIPANIPLRRILHQENKWNEPISCGKTNIYWE